MGDERKEGMKKGMYLGGGFGNSEIQNSDTPPPPLHLPVFHSPLSYSRPSFLPSPPIPWREEEEWAIWGGFRKGSMGEGERQENAHRLNIRPSIPSMS